MKHQCRPDVWKVLRVGLIISILTVFICHELAFRPYNNYQGLCTVGIVMTFTTQIILCVSEGHEEGLLVIVLCLHAFRYMIAEWPPVCSA